MHKFRLIVSVLIMGLFASCQTVPKPTVNAATDKPLYEDSLPPFPPDTIDGVLVKIGTESILLSDLNQAMEFYPQLSQKDVLNALVDEKIIEIKAHDIGIEVGEEELSRSIQEFLAQQNITEDILLNELQKNGKTLQEYREEFKKEVVKQQLIGRVISPFVTVTNDEVNRYYLQQTKNVKQVEKVKLRSLMIPIPDDYDGDALKYELVQKVQTEVENKTDFVALVRAHSGAQDTAQTLGVLPPKSLSELPEEVQKKLTDLQVDQVIGPIALGQSVFFFQYMGAEFTADSDLNTHFEEWKNRLLNIKFTEHLVEYLRKEKSSLKIVTRPYDFQKLS